jgi:N-methylhydantoinase B
MCDEVLESIMLALAEPLPDRVVAGWNQALGTVYAARDQRTGRQKVYFGAFQRGGPGASRGGDGFDALGFTGAVGQMRSPDVETYEISHPCFIEAYEFLPDSAGPGRWRGGLGTRTVRRLLADEQTGATLGDDLGSEGARPAQGLFGGHPAGLNRLTLELPDGSEREWGSKELIRGLPYGTRVVATIGGGAGYGDPFDRPAHLVRDEVRDGLLSVSRAEGIYGVVIDDQNWEVDVEASTARRRQRRRETSETP